MHRRKQRPCSFWGDSQWKIVFESGTLKNEKLGAAVKTVKHDLDIPADKFKRK